jgi:hypothetical protein
MGRVVVREHPDPQVGEFYGADFVLGLMLHEAAHSTAGEPKNIVITAAGANAIGGYGYITPDNLVSGFRKYETQRQNARIRPVGNFLEEGFADLTRVRLLQRAGREPKIDGIVEGPEVWLLGSDAAPPEDDADLGRITMPARFAAAIAILDDGWVASYDVSANFAAYGLELLDQHTPGLFEQMQAARREPHRYAEVIKAINSIEPGLYKELRKIAYTREGFKGGLRLIETAVARRP